MIKRALFFLSLLISLAASGQGPVQWKYVAEKIGDKIYKVSITAQIEEPWHIYSQQTPEGGPLPTKLSFTKNPLLSLQGKPKEEGDMEVYFEKVFGVDVYAYMGKVDFVQVVKLKSNAKTTIRGNIEYMACTSERCLTPATFNFNIPLN